MGFSIPGASTIGKVVDWGKDKVDDAADKVTDVAKQGGTAVVNTVASGARNLREAAGPVTHPIASAANALREKASDAYDGARDRVTSTTNTVREKAGDVINGVRDKAGDAINGARDRVSSAIDGVRDKAADVRDGIGDAVDTVRYGVSGAADRASDIASGAWDATRTLATPDGFDRAVYGLTDPVGGLDPGDSVAFDAGGEVNAAVSVSGGAAVEVERNADGTYTISGEVDGAVGGKISDTGLTFGGGARTEFTADNAQDAREIAATLIKTGVANASTASPIGLLAAPVTNFLYGPSKEELQQLGDHLSAVELEGNVAAGLGARLGLTPDVDAGGEAGAQGELALRVEFEGGRPTAAVSRTTIQGDGDVGAGVAGLLPDGVVNDVKKSTGVDPRDVLSGGDATVSITVENRVNLKSTGADTPGWKALTVMGTNGQGLPGIVPDGEPTSKLTIAADGTAEQGRGIHAEVSIDGLEPSDAVNVARNVAKGDVAGAVKSADTQIDYDVHGTHVRNDGIDADFVVGGVHATRTITQADTPYSGTILPGIATIGSTPGVPISGARPIDMGKTYEVGVRQQYGDTPFQQRTFTTVVDGREVNGVADNVAEIDGKNTAVEAKFVDDWNTSLRNPDSAEGGRPWARAEQAQMIEQAKKYDAAFDQVIYHTNSPELAAHYAKAFEDAGIDNVKFVITPAIR